MKLLFTSDANGFEYKNPYTWLVEIKSDISIQEIKKLEGKQLGAFRVGGRLNELMDDLKKIGIESSIISYGRRSDYNDDIPEYKLISGNY